jgi:hypothetical protein
MALEPLFIEARFFDFDKPEQDLYETQPNWVQGMIKDAINYTGFADEWGAPFEK